jgi:anti-sigma regulatory factor (Ser/Thr protein kinase)
MAIARNGPMCSVTVPHERSSVRAARHALAAELAANGIGTPMRDDAVLVLSELVSNAIKHAAPLPSGHISVCWYIRQDRLHLEITDGGGQTRPQAAVAAVSSLGGRGLDIVRTICSAWGVTEHGNAVTVWADLPRPAMA